MQSAYIETDEEIDIKISVFEHNTTIKIGIVYTKLAK